MLIMVSVNVIHPDNHIVVKSKVVQKALSSVPEEHTQKSVYLELRPSLNKMHIIYFP